MACSHQATFKEYFVGQSGFEELKKYIKHGGDFSKELSQILQERCDLEAQYAKGLCKLSAKLLKASRECVGSVAHAWQLVGAQLESQGNFHRDLGCALTEEVVRPLRSLVDAQHKIRKSVESMVEKTARNLSEWRAAESKAKKHGYFCARENEKMQEPAVSRNRLLSDKDFAKIHAFVEFQLETKRRKTEESMRRANMDYYSLCVRAERARLEWESAVGKGSQCLQTLEEERLAHLKAVAGKYHRHLSILGPGITQSTESLQEPINCCDVNTDIQTVISVRGHSATHCEQLLPDFYAEDTTNAMNKERRQQALQKVVQTIGQDLEREKKGKQGVENLARALQETPNFGGEESQQDVKEKLRHMRAMLRYLEATRLKVHNSMADIDGRSKVNHALLQCMNSYKDKQGLIQTVLKTPEWMLSEVSNDSTCSSPDWIDDRGTADGTSGQPDSDFDEFSSQASEGETKPYIGKCHVLYDYEAKLNDELTIKQGDVIDIQEKQPDDWWLGELRGTQGIFPATYVEEID